MANPEKNYKTLIRLSEQRIEEIRNNMGVFLDKREALEQENLRMQQELVTERQQFNEMPNAQFAFANFEANIRVKTENNEMFIKHVDAEIEKLREKMRLEFAESKKYERLLELYEERVRKKADQVEIALADERNLNQYQAAHSDA
jgi:hypothetical protein